MDKTGKKEKECVVTAISQEEFINEYPVNQVQVDKQTVTVDIGTHGCGICS